MPRWIDMRLPCFIVVLAAACGPQPTPQPLTGHATQPAASGEPPKVAWIDNGFDVTRLPAISADGKVIVLAIQDSDGGRGNPNLRFVERDRRDAEAPRPFVVLFANDADTMFDAGGMTQPLRDEIAAGNRWLADANARHRLVPLVPLTIEDAATGLGDQTRASGGGVTVEWKAGTLRIARGGKPVVERAMPGWLVEDKPLYTGASETCSNPSFLAAAAVDVAHSAAVVTIGYTGTDTCWEPPAAPHVVAW